MNNLYSSLQYDEAIALLFKQVPSFQKVGATAYHPGLENMMDFDRELGYPHRKYKTIHIAGTNGKGSVAHILAAIYMGYGYKTGLYTSPHLVDFRERIKVNGEMISKDGVLSFLSRYGGFIGEKNPSFFEITTAMAFDWFARTAVDIAIIETGLGGRFDSTNIITPILSIITAIGMDHCDILGDTIEKIAAEKAGIIKHGVPAVVGEVPESAEKVIRKKAADEGSVILFSKDCTERIDLTPEEMDLKGEYQRVNLRTVSAAVNVLGKFSIHDDTLLSAVKKAGKLTGLHGRWEQLSSDPLIICDIAHNEHALTPAMKQLGELYSKGKFGRIVMIFGVMADKDLHAMMGLLPSNAYYYFTNASSSRALNASKLSMSLSSLNLHGEITPSVRDAVSRYLKAAKSDDLVYIGGSSYVVAEAIPLFK